MRPPHELGMWMRAQLRAGGHMLAASLRVEDTAFKRRQLDVLPDLLKTIAEAKGKNPKLTERGVIEVLSL